MKLFWTFVILNVVNVILQTIKSIATVKCGKGVAALVNAAAYGLYTIVIVYTNCDLPLMTKAAVVAVCNLIGVWVVKWLEEKAKKDRLWKVEASVPKDMIADIERMLLEGGLPHNCLRTTGNYDIFNIFCATQRDSLMVRELLEAGDIKYFVSESKTL